MGNSGKEKPNAIPSQGKCPALDELVPQLYQQLKIIARSHLQHERPGHTLQPTALVHEAYLRLAAQDGNATRDRRHFLIAAANVIRQVLIDHSRARAAQKRSTRGGRITLSGLDIGGKISANPIDLMDLDDALNRLAKLNERAVRVVELRFFGGLSVEETAEALDISTRTVANDSSVARAWLRRELKEHQHD